MKKVIVIIAVCSSLFAQDYKIYGYIDKLNEYSEQMSNYKDQLTDYQASIINLPSTTKNDLEYSISRDLHNIADQANMYTFAVTILLMIYQKISVDENKESAANIMSIYINLAIDSTGPAIAGINTSIDTSHRRFLKSIGKNILRDVKEIRSYLSSMEIS